jgi:hypothetical protein
MTKMFLFALTLLGAATATAQVGGFASLTYGYHSDPMYNYETIPDQLRQGYLELQYTAPAGSGVLSAGYVGGLMIFNEFTDRNYLEHSLRLGYRDIFGRKITDGQHLPAEDGEANDEDEDEDEEEEPPVDVDSVRTYLDLQLRGSARHDKDAFREFNNTGVSQSSVIRFPLGAWYLRVMNDAGYRSYQNIPELSNVTEYLTVQTGRVFWNVLNAGVAVAGGVKYYTTDMYDTTQYESTRTYVEKASGKGKGGAKLVESSGKKILTNAATTISWQVAGGVFASYTWTGGSLAVDGWYRFNPGKATRYLAQYVNSTMLNEDIYNDFFAYTGTEGRMVYQQDLPFGVRSTLTVTLARRQFSAPALDLEGNELGNNRRDIHGIAEVWVSRFVPLGDGLGLDVAVSGGWARNRSNDAYNDYGLYQAGLSVGVGF